MSRALPRIPLSRPRRWRLIVIPFIGLVLAALAAAQEPGTIKVSEKGPQVGEIVPDFRLPDQNGKFWTRDSIMGPKGAMLVFVRSADWCPYCKTQLVELNEQFAQLQKQGYGVATISYDPQDILAGFAAQHGIRYTMLSDVGSEVIQRFGLLNPVPEWAISAAKDDPKVAQDIQTYVSVFNPNERMVGIAFPGNIIIDRNGRVTSRRFEDSYIERNTVSSILLQLGADTTASVNATRIDTRQLEITSYSSNPEVAMGNRFSLVLDIAPKEAMHVYAPGAEADGYRVIKLRMEENPDVGFSEVQYPESETYFFEPLNEREPVFQKPFRMIQEAVLTGGLEAFERLRGRKSVTIKGTLQYQACNDRECFNPVSVPLEWTLAIRDLVTQQTQRP